MPAGKNTLYITFDGLTDPLGQSQILPYLLGIAGNGYHITILSCEKEVRLQSEKQNIEKTIEQLPISWNYIIYDEAGGFVSRFIYTRKLRWLAKKICADKNIKLVHCRSYLASLTGLYLKINKGIPFVFDMRGFWADERIDGGIWKKANVLHRVFYTYFKQKEKQFFEHANAVVSLTNAGLEVMQRNFPDSALSKKTTVIPCCTNTNLFIRKPYLEQKNRLNVKEGEHVIVYTGSVGTWYYTKEMIDCMIVWKKHIPNLKLLVLTKDTEVLKNLLNTYSAEQQSIVISAAASYKEVANYLSLANAAIFFIKPAPSKTASSPTKMAECWALDLPIITNSGIGDNDLYFGKYQGGILLKEFNTEAYEQACRDYISLSNTSGHYRKIAVDFFDLKMGIEKYTDIYNTLVTN